MAYGAITAFLGTKPTSAQIEAWLRAHLSGKSPDEIIAMIVADLPNLIALQEKADRAEDLEREVKNLEWNLKRLRGEGQMDDCQVEGFCLDCGELASPVESPQ